MSEPERPNPDRLLATLQKDEARKKRGKLKVFFGMAPGVGKTYAMLEAARRELAAGREVVSGYVETHGRKETDALAEGLPVLAAAPDRVPRGESHRDGPGRAAGAASAIGAGG